MSITSDIRTYADSAVTQGKQVFDQTLRTTQAQLDDARENAQNVASKAGDTVADLRASAEKAINLDAIKHAVEPYLVQVREYGQSVTDRAEGVVNSLRSDKRFGGVVDSVVETATAVSGTVIGTVQERVVKPVQSFAGVGSKPAAKKPSPTRATKPATTRPSSKPSSKSASKSTSTSASTSASTPTRKSTARKAPAKPAATS